MSDQATPLSGARPLTRRELEAKIIARAWRDPGFKQQLLENPHLALQSELREIDPSIVLPATLQVHVHAEKPNVYHLVLPRNPRDIPLGEVVGDNLEALASQTVAVVTTTTNAVINNNVSIANAQTFNMTTVVGNVVA
jgi:hypothetical protein